MGISSPLLVAALALCLSACVTSDAPLPQPASQVVAPLPKAYSCDQLRKAAAEYAALPPGSMTQVFVDDYRDERRQLRAVHGLPETTACTKVGA